MLDGEEISQILNKRFLKIEFRVFVFQVQKLQHQWISYLSLTNTLSLMLNGTRKTIIKNFSRCLSVFVMEPTDMRKSNDDSLIMATSYKNYANVVWPIKCLSISRAASRPSLIAHTTKDCPRRQSPAAKILSPLVLYLP